MADTFLKTTYHKDVLAGFKKAKALGPDVSSEDIIEHIGMELRCSRPEIDDVEGPKGNKVKNFYPIFMDVPSVRARYHLTPVKRKFGASQPS